jgi:predicted enzyme related to lactoylglutathione lyase
VIGVERTDFVGIPVTDRERAVKFYGETLGLKRNPLSSDEWPEFETGNVTLLLNTPEQTGVPFSPSNVAIALRVSDVAAAMERLKEAGVEFMFPDPYDSSVCHMAFFKDPDGNSLILHHRYAPYRDGSLPRA